ncbi:MAG: tetratricopeptide repeat protein [Polyangiaceae bacterium]|nr:tetratricopeptide repeat protein [Polyangiaceae bacterium]MCW5791615.1 tetratricopeptide repeat protein [Polyangiaceae bacterium]
MRRPDGQPHGQPRLALRVPPRRRALLGGALLGLALLLVGGLSSQAAEAKPSVWQAAKDPERARAERARVSAERMLSRALMAERLSARSAQSLERASLAMLELSEGHGGPAHDYLLGHLLALHGSDLERARAVLRRALRRAPDSPVARRAWFDLGVVSAKLGDGAGEHRAYTQGLSTAWERDLRGNLYLNRAESSMVAGRLMDALTDYHAAVRAASDPHVQALAYWGLAIVRERLGDLPKALEAAGLAHRIAPNALQLPSVFFVPRYDLHYYQALTFMALGRETTALHERVRWLGQAVSAWARYVRAAEADTEPGAGVWLPNARLHHASCERQLKEARRALASRPRAREAPAPDEDAL